MKVLLDPAHGEDVKGKRSPDYRLREWSWSREVIGMLEKRFDQLGIAHERTWDGDNEPGLGKRCKIANANAKIEPCILISMHCDALGNGEWMKARGWSARVGLNASTKSKKLATTIAKVAQEKGIKVRTPKPGQLYWQQNLAICRDTSMPAVLIENLFMDNKEDLEYLLSDEGKRTLTEIIVEGVCNYLGKIYEE